MYILGDIGNSETKVVLVNSKNRIIKRINFQTKKINNELLKSKFSSLIKNFTKIEKVLFCSVVPQSYKLIKNIIFRNLKKKML